MGERVAELRCSPIAARPGQSLTPNADAITVSPRSQALILGWFQKVIQLFSFRNTTLVILHRELRMKWGLGAPAAAQAGGVMCPQEWPLSRAR